MGDLIDRQAAIDALDCINGTEEVLRSLPPAQPEPTRIIPETRAIPSDDDRVSLSERVTATYYDDEYEEWSQKTVTVRDVLDAVCDEYTVLPTIQPEPKWIPVSERLPEKGGEYLVSVHHTIGAISVFHPEKDTYVDDVAIMKYCGKFPSTVRAWMPLPEPYNPNK